MNILMLLKRSVSSQCPIRPAVCCCCIPKGAHACRVRYMPNRPSVWCVCFAHYICWTIGIIVQMCLQIMHQLGYAGWCLWLILLLLYCSYVYAYAFFCGFSIFRLGIDESMLHTQKNICLVACYDTFDMRVSLCMSFYTTNRLCLLNRIKLQIYLEHRKIGI